MNTFLWQNDSPELIEMVEMCCICWEACCGNRFCWCCCCEICLSRLSGCCWGLGEPTGEVLCVGDCGVCCWVCSIENCWAMVVGDVADTVVLVLEPRLNELLVNWLTLFERLRMSVSGWGLRFFDDSKYGKQKLLKNSFEEELKSFVIFTSIKSNWLIRWLLLLIGSCG